MTRESTFDVVIIGGGIAGLTLAFSLLNRGLKPLIINDPNDKNAASPATHGISTIKGILESDQSLFGEKLAGHRGFLNWLRSVETAAGISRPNEVAVCGVRESFINLKHFQKEFGRIYRRDFTGAKCVTYSQGGPEFFSCFYPSDWWVKPEHLFQVLRRAVQRLGGVFMDDRVHAVTHKNSGEWTIESLREERDVRQLAICAGAGTPALVKELKILDEPIFAVSGWTFTAEATEDMPARVKGTSGVVAKNGTLHWGSSSDPAVNLQDDLPAQPDSPADHLRVGTELLVKLGCDPANLNAQSVKPRFGVRCRSRGRAPIIKRITRGKSFLYLNFAYYKSGMILAWHNAEVLADMIKDDYQR